MCNIGCLQEDEEGACLVGPSKKVFCFIAILDAFEYSEIDDLLIEEMAGQGEAA